MNKPNVLSVQGNMLVPLECWVEWRIYLYVSRKEENSSYLITFIAHIEVNFLEFGIQEVAIKQSVLGC